LKIPFTSRLNQVSRSFLAIFLLLGLNQLHHLSKLTPFGGGMVRTSNRIEAHVTGSMPPFIGDKTPMLVG